MSYLVTDGQLRSWLDGLVESGREVVAPVEGGGPLRFEAVRSSDGVVMDGRRTRWSPKEFYFPREESLFSYQVDDDGTVRLQEDPPRTGERVLFGLPPCDAAGLERLVAVFRHGPGDPWVLARRAATAVVSWTCAQVGPECFCTAVGGSPGGDEGVDIQVTGLEDGRHLLTPLTDRGRGLVQETGSEDWTEAPDEAMDEARHRIRQAEEAVDRNAFPASAPGALEEGFQDPVWDEVAEPCLGCRVCTTVCPSCSCFDVYDEGDQESGTRTRCWDGCTQPSFTSHATGHNPRPTQATRLRQRIMHKFSYYPREHGGLSMCVGCGRCALLCPAGLDVHQTVMRVLERSGAAEGAAEGAGHDG